MELVQSAHEPDVDMGTADKNETQNPKQPCLKYEKCGYHTYEHKFHPDNNHKYFQQYDLWNQ